MKPLIGQRPDTGHPLFPSAGSWLFNEGAGSTAHDASGNGNHGTLTNMDWVPEGTEFDGSDGYIALADAIEPGTEDWWIAFWVRLDSYPDVGDEMALCGNVSNTNSDGVFVNCNGDVFLRIGGTLGTKLDDSPIPLNEWTHVIVAREYSASQLTVYFNGSAGLIFGKNDTGNPWRNQLTTVYSWSIDDGGEA